MQYINVPAGNYNLVLGEDILSMNTAKIYLQCQTSLGAINILLPRITNPNGTSLKNWWFTVYINDVDGNASANNIKITPHPLDKINGSGAQVILNANGITGCINISGIDSWKFDVGSSNGSVDFFPNATYPVVRIINDVSGAGHHDLYTVPAGRKAFLKGIRILNTNVGNNSLLGELKVGLNYYPISPNPSTSSGGVSISSSQYLFNAEEGFSIKTSVAGFSAWADIIEFSDSSPLKTIAIFNPIVGDNILYITPANKQAIIIYAYTVGLSIQPPLVGGLLKWCNNSGITSNIKLNIVPFGQIVSPNNIFIPLTTVFNLTAPTPSLPAVLSDGDFISVNTDNGAVDQVVSIVIYEKDI